MSTPPSRSNPNSLIGAPAIRAAKPPPDHLFNCSTAQAVLQMIEQWQANRSGYEERIWPDLKQQLEADRSAARERFRE